MNAALADNDQHTSATPTTANNDNANKYDIYKRMQKMGVPNTSIQQKMQIDGFTESDINNFLNAPLGATTTTTATTAPKPTITSNTTSLGATSAAGATAAGAVGGGGGVGGGGVGGGKYEKYRKMLSMNIPEMAVRRKMTQVHSVVYDIVCDV